MDEKLKKWGIILLVLIFLIQLIAIITLGVMYNAAKDSYIFYQEKDFKTNWGNCMNNLGECNANLAECQDGVKYFKEQYLKCKNNGYWCYH